MRAILAVGRRAWGRVRPLLGRRSGKLVGGALLGLALFGLVPVVQFTDPLSTVILDRDGELLGASFAADGQWRFGLARTVPPRFVTAITRYEDRRFFYHPGVDPLAIARAIVQNLRSGGIPTGGRTLPPQRGRLPRTGPPPHHR